MVPQVEGLTRAQGNCTDHVTKKGDSAGSSSEKTTEDTGETDEECMFALDKWDAWFSDDSDDDISESD